MVNRVWLFRFSSLVPCALAAVFLALHLTVARPVDQHSTVVGYLSPLQVSRPPCPGPWQARKYDGGSYYVGRVVVRFFLTVDTPACVEPVVLYEYVCGTDSDDTLARTKVAYPLNVSIAGLGWNDTGRCAFAVGLDALSPFLGLGVFFAIVGGFASLSWCYKSTGNPDSTSELSTLVPSASV